MGDKDNPKMHVFSTFPTIDVYKKNSHKLKIKQEKENCQFFTHK